MIHPEFTKHTEKYGPEDFQEGDLYLPGTESPPVVCLLHGGFWQMPYDRSQLTAVSIDLVSRGFAVWNIEYRRLGAEGGGWPGTFNDVIAAVNHLESFVDSGISLNLERVIVAGHSAGGHLALWCAGQTDTVSETFTRLRIKPAAVVGLAPVADLVGAYEAREGDNPIAKLLGGTPAEVPDRYLIGSPMAMVPLGVRHLVIHGTADEALPIELTRNYARAAKNAGDEIDFIELADVGHMDYVDPSSKAHSLLCKWLAQTSM